MQTLLQLFNKLEIKEGTDEETENSSKEEKGAAEISHGEEMRGREEKKGVRHKQD